jgi:hypothetical protein
MKSALLTHNFQFSIKNNQKIERIQKINIKIKILMIKISANNIKSILMLSCYFQEIMMKT